MSMLHMLAPKGQIKHLCIQPSRPVIHVFLPWVEQTLVVHNTDDDSSAVKVAIRENVWYLHTRKLCHFNPYNEETMSEYLETWSEAKQSRQGMVPKLHIVCPGLQEEWDLTRSTLRQYVEESNTKAKEMGMISNLDWLDVESCIVFEPTEPRLISFTDDGGRPLTPMDFQQPSATACQVCSDTIYKVVPMLLEDDDFFDLQFGSRLYDSDEDRDSAANYYYDGEDDFYFEERRRW
ncbi:hypothetical protein M231_05710 [Tremella mesenterica]|uniref:Uncharacterized protein n=1 Tax=Tremella mesenterica TaxID=5217 RepID=A0A4Q1BHD0_TREME|nr:hypothetical protein M231_05710 [Tremella mesenterica]